MWGEIWGKVILLHHKQVTCCTHVRMTSLWCKLGFPNFKCCWRILTCETSRQWKTFQTNYCDKEKPQQAIFAQLMSNNKLFISLINCWKIAINQPLVFVWLYVIWYLDDVVGGMWEKHVLEVCQGVLGWNKESGNYRSCVAYWPGYKILNNHYVPCTSVQSA